MLQYQLGLGRSLPANQLKFAGRAPEPSGPNTRRAREPITVQSQKNIVQRLLMQAANDRNISTIPQPRKPSQTIIVETISVARKPITTFLLIVVDKD